MSRKDGSFKIQRRSSASDIKLVDTSLSFSPISAVEENPSIKKPSRLVLDHRDELLTYEQKKLDVIAKKLQQKFINKLNSDLMRDNMLDKFFVQQLVDCSEEDGKQQTGNAWEHIQQFLSGTQKSLLILGTVGQGKTHLMQMLTRQVWKDYDEDRQAKKLGTIPLYIDLSKMPQFRMQGELLKYFLEDNGLNSSRIDFLRSNQPLLLMLDKYDEIQPRINLYKENSWEDGWQQLRTITACRSEVLEFKKNKSVYFCPSQKSKETLAVVYKELTLLPFYEEQIEQYVKNYLEQNKSDLKQTKHVSKEDDWSQASTYTKYFKKIPGLWELVRTPRGLGLLVPKLRQVIKDARKKDIILMSIADSDQKIETRTIKELLKRYESYEEFQGNSVLIRRKDQYFLYDSLEMQEERPILELDSHKFRDIKFTPSLRPVKTKNDENSVLHAILGEWNSLEGQFICFDILKKMDKIREAIVNDNGPDMQKLIKAGIQELVKSDHENIGKSIRNLKNQLNEHKMQRPDQRLSLHSRSHKASNKEYKLLSSDVEPEADEYQFDFEITEEMKQEYAHYVSTEHVELSVSQLNILAYIFDLAIKYRDKASDVFEETLGSGKTLINVQRDDKNHFKRLEVCSFHSIAA